MAGEVQHGDGARVAIRPKSLSDFGGDRRGVHLGYSLAHIPGAILAPLLFGTWPGIDW